MPNDPDLDEKGALLLRNRIRENMLVWIQLLGAEQRCFGGALAAVHPSLSDGYFNFGANRVDVTPGELQRASAWMELQGRSPHFYVGAGEAAGLEQSGVVYTLLNAEGEGRYHSEVALVGREQVDQHAALLVSDYPFPEPYLRPLAAAYRQAVEQGALLLEAQQEGKPVASLLMALDDGCAGIYGVVTARAHRGKGLAGRLVEHGVALARAAGCEWITLQADEGSPAERLYERLGFRATDRVLAYVKQRAL